MANPIESRNSKLDILNFSRSSEMSGDINISLSIDASGSQIAQYLPQDKLSQMLTRDRIPANHLSNVSMCSILESPPDPRDWIFENLAGSRATTGTITGTNNDTNNDANTTDILAEQIAKLSIIGPYPNATASRRLSTAFMPGEYDMREFSSPSRDQANRATCASIVAAEIKEIQTRMLGGTVDSLSSEYIYYHRGNKPSSGMYGRDAFSILQKCGTVDEKEYPYQPEDNTSPAPSKKLIKKAVSNRICNYARIKTLNGIKRALYEVGPCYLFLPLYTTRPEFWKPDDIGTTEGHAICVLGWTREGLILKNSWGPDWNGDGYIILPYVEYNNSWECWVAIPLRTEQLKKENSVKSEPRSLRDSGNGRKLRTVSNISESERRTSIVIKHQACKELSNNSPESDHVNHHNDHKCCNM